MSVNEQSWSAGQLPATSELRTTGPGASEIVDLSPPAVVTTGVPALEAVDLSKVYAGDTVGLHPLNLKVPAGSVFAMLGPNGSGKTTTVRLLAGILTPTTGRAVIFGLRTDQNVSAIHALCGVLTETAGAYERLNADENLTFFGRMHGLSENEIRLRSDQILDFFDLAAVRNRRVGTYSTGMKKRFLLAVAMLHRPRLLFLDEPTSGLDPESASQVNGLIRRLAKEEQVTTFLCTHQLRYAEDICDMFGFISHGHLLGAGTLPELWARQGNYSYLELRGSALPCNLLGERARTGAVRVPVANDEEADAWIRRVIAAGGHIFEARRHRMTLEQLYFLFQAEARAAGKVRPEAAVGDGAQVGM